MSTSIKIIEKPDWVSWEEIKECLINAHSINRAKGINMTHYQWPEEKLRDLIEPNGVMLVALDGEKIVGTAAFSEKQGSTWYVKGRYAYICFDSVLPEYSGCGIFKKLDILREEIIKERGYGVFIGDTHIKNKSRIRIAKKNGYHLVRCFRGKNSDHYSVVIAKWLNGCPYSRFYCLARFYYSWVIVHLYTVYGEIKRCFK